MASSDGNMERFAYDVCVHVLEKFGIFKAPDDTRKQNKYVRYDFLPRISRSVVSFAIWIRADFKNTLEDRCKTADLSNNEIMWIFDDYLVPNDKFSGKHWTEKVCISLALCTEYIQFASTKDFSVSLNKLVIGWSDFFEKHLRSHFEEKGGFTRLYNYLEISQIGQLGNFQEAFISKYCLPYGAKECTTELARECIEKQGFNISLEKTIFGIKKLDYLQGFLRSEESKPEETCSGTSDSEEDSSSTSANSDVKTLKNVSSDVGDSEVSSSTSTNSDVNTLMNVSRDASDLQDSSSTSTNSDVNTLMNVSSDASDLQDSRSTSTNNDVKTLKNASSDSEDSSSSSSNSDANTVKNVSSDASKSEEDSSSSSANSDASDSEISQNNLLGIPPHEEMLREIDPFFVENIPSLPKARSSSKSPEHETGPNDASKSPEHETGPNDASKSPERESVSNDSHPLSPAESEDLKERVEQILSKLESDMDELRAFLYEHRLLPMKSGRRGSRLHVKDSKDKFLPEGPEGLI